MTASVQIDKSTPKLVDFRTWMRTAFDEQDEAEVECDA